MATIVDYVRSANEGFDRRPLGRVDSLCLSWLAYLRLPEELEAACGEGVRLSQLADDEARHRLVATMHDAEETMRMLDALAASPRFAGVRVGGCLADSSDEPVRQFAGMTFSLPDGGGTYVSFRGTDDTVFGWKENFRLVSDEPVASQVSAAAYLNRVGRVATSPLYVGGHSKGGNLAVYACGMVRDGVRSRIETCFSHDGPGLNPQLVELTGWQGGVAIDKTVPRESLVGMLFERSQDGLTIVRSTAQGPRQHAPLSWEVSGDDFVCERGLDYDAWRLSQRLNDWLEAMGARDCACFAELLSWLLDVTGETTFSGLLRRWSMNSAAMREALAAAPFEDRTLFERVMGDLVATVALGSAQEHARPEAGTPEAAGSAARRVEDLSAHVDDRLSRIDRYLGL